MKGKLKIGVSLTECGTWEVRDGKVIFKMYACRAVVFDDLEAVAKKDQFPTTRVISGINDTYEAGYALLVSDAKLVEVDHDPIDPTTLIDGREITVADGTHDEECWPATTTQYLVNSETEGWDCPAVDQ